MKYKSRRFVAGSVRIVGRAPEDYAQDLQEILEKLLLSITGSIPSGFNDVVAATLSLNAAAVAGALTSGWAAADHVHALDLLLAAKGDILSHDGTDYVKIGLAGAPDGWVPTASAAAPTGFTWAAPSGGVAEPAAPTIRERSLTNYQLAEATVGQYALRKILRQNFR